MWAYVNVDDLGTAVNHAVTDSTKYVANVETEIRYCYRFLRGESSLLLVNEQRRPTSVTWEIRTTIS